MSLKNKLLRRRGTGCKPSGVDQRDYDIDKVGLATPISDGCDNLCYLRLYRDQQTASCCVGKAIANAIDVHTAASKCSDDYEPASSLDIYRRARGPRFRIVTDSGTSIRAGVDAVHKGGFSDESDHPFRDGVLWVNKYPGTRSIASRIARAGIKYAWIKEEGYARIPAICAALEAVHPVIVRTPVSASWTHGEPHIFDASVLAEDIDGWHATMLLDYRRVAGHGVLVRDINSWGADFKEHGTMWLREDYLASPLVGDICVLYGLDRIIREALYADFD